MDSLTFAFYDPLSIEQVQAVAGWLSLPVSAAQPYANPVEIHPGGLVFGIADGTITDVSRVRAHLPVSHAWGSAGHPRIGVDRYRLPEPVPIAEDLAGLLPNLCNANGDCMKGKLADRQMVTPIPRGLGEGLWRQVAAQAEPVVLAAAANQTIDQYLDQLALGEILARRNLSQADKLQFVDAFLRQGPFRAAAEKLQPVCPMTRLEDGLDLCPIVPWHRLSDAEKLDPNHVLRLLEDLHDLFKVGAVYFDEDGHPQVSSCCGFQGLETRYFPGPDGVPAWDFTAAQKKYLARHAREVSFGQCGAAR